MAEYKGVNPINIILAAGGFWILFKLLTGGAILATVINFTSPLLWITIGVFVLWWFTRK